VSFEILSTGGLFGSGIYTLNQKSLQLSLTTSGSFDSSSFFLFYSSSLLVSYTEIRELKNRYPDGLNGAFSFIGSFVSSSIFSGSYFNFELFAAFIFIILS